MLAGLWYCDYLTYFECWIKLDVYDDEPDKFTYLINTEKSNLEVTFDLLNGAVLTSMFRARHPISLRVHSNIFILS